MMTGEEGLRATRGFDREQRDGDSWDWDCRVRSALTGSRAPEHTVPNQ